MRKQFFFGLLFVLLLVTVKTPTTSTAAPKILKIGLVQGLQSSTGIDSVKTIKLEVNKDNKNGGLSIGGEKYQIQLVEYDAGATQDTLTTAVNKLVYQDNVKYIITGGGTGMPAIPAITEPNKVLVFLPTQMTPTWSPNWKYCFDGAATAVPQAVVIGWICKNYPDQAKNILLAYSDDAMGNLILKIVRGVFAGFGVTPNAVSFPATASDLSSLGTKVATMNPGAFCAIAADPTKWGLAYNAARDAGYKGLYFSGSIQSVPLLSNVLNKSALEGFLSGAYATEFTPPLNQTAADFMNDWIAQHGKWTSPSLYAIPNYYCLKTAFQQAGSIEVDKVAAVLSNGMKYDTPCGPAQMISRPDIGVSRTVNSIYTVYMKVIKNGQAFLVATVAPDEGVSYFQANIKPPQSQSK